MSLGIILVRLVCVLIVGLVVCHVIRVPGVSRVMLGIILILRRELVKNVVYWLLTVVNVHQQLA